MTRRSDSSQRPPVGPAAGEPSASEPGCVDFKVVLSAYLDGELPTGERRGADRHLLTCAACRSLLERAEANDSALRALCARDAAFTERAAAAVPLPLGFENAVLARVRRRTTMRWRRVSGSLGLLAAAAAIAFAAVVYYVDRGGGAGAPSRGGDPSRGGEMVRDDSDPGWSELGDGVFGPPAPNDAKGFGRGAASLTADEVQALRSVASVLALASTTPFENLAARERLRAIASYDELLGRLKALEARLDTVDRRAVAAARSAIFEIERNQPDVAQWNALQDDLRQSALPEAVERIVVESERAARRSL